MGHVLGKDVLRKEIGPNRVYPTDFVPHSGIVKARPGSILPIQTP